MLEKPAIADELIIRAVDTAYNVRVASLKFLPLGYDPNAGVYRATSHDGIDYFLKVKKGEVSISSLAVPRFLQDSGIAQVIAPLLTRDQQLSVSIAPFTLILYPFIEGKTATEVGMSDDQWVELGAALRQMHTMPLSPDLIQQMRRETFTSKGSGLIRAVDAKIQGSTFSDPLQREIAALWEGQRTIILAITDHAEALARTLRSRSPEFVLCHADIHTANLLVDRTGHFAIVDWDEALLAPIERDLMFVTGDGAGASVAYSTEAQALFFQGYGAVEIDSQAMAYYRCDWITQDVGEYAASIFVKADVGDETKAESARILRGMFQSGSNVEAAYRLI